MSIYVKKFRAKDGPQSNKLPLILVKKYIEINSQHLILLFQALGILYLLP
jgi:hypothetical protein